MKFTATIITCNAALLIGHLLENISDLFDKVIVVDGPSAPGVGQAAGDGRLLTGGKPYSIDGTVDIVKKFQEKSPHVILISMPRPWNGKTEKFNVALSRTEPGYIWQMDYDEFYHRSHIHALKSFLKENPQITEVDFWAYHFWGDVNHHTPIAEGEWGNNPEWRRVFKFNGSEHWLSHEPPMMSRMDNCLLTRDDTKEMGIMMYHYSYCVESQFLQKNTFYSANFVDEWRRWKRGQESKRLCVFEGKHPIDVSFLAP